MKKPSYLSLWVDGELGFPLKTGLRGCKTHGPRKKRREKPALNPVGMFRRVYALLCVLTCLMMLWALLGVSWAMPPFGSDENPTVNEVSGHYVGQAEHETGAENVIAGMILNYRGFDTFGESCVLFLAVCCVMQLLWNTGADAGEKRAVDFGGTDVILSCVCRVLLPCVLCFGLCVLFNGHTSPGGGFSGGSILGATLIVYALAFGDGAVSRFFTKRVFNLVRITGLMVYALLFGCYIFLGANGIDSELSRYIVLVVDIAVGLVVMSTMYGFYSFYTKGEL